MRVSPFLATVVFVIPAFACAAQLLAQTTPPPVAPASMSLFHRAVNEDPQLSSYIATASLVVRVVSPIPARKTLSGTAYFLRPTLLIRFDNVPRALSVFKELRTSDTDYEGDSAQYTPAPGTDDGKDSTFTLVPKKSDARVKQVLMKVDDGTAELIEADWLYTNGATLIFEPSYQTTSGVRVMVREQITAHFPQYRVAGTLTLSGHQINATVDPSIFASPAPH